MHSWLQLRSRIPPFRRRRPGGAWRRLDLADIRGQQVLADAQSANAAAHDTYTMVRRYRVTYDDGGWWNFWQNTRIGDQLVEVFILDEGGTQVTISETDGRIRITPPDEVASRLLRERTQQIAADAAAAVVILEGIVQVTVIASFFVPGPEDVVIEGVLATKLAQAGIKAFVNKSTGLIRYCFQKGDEVYEIGEASAKQILGNQADEVIGETATEARKILGNSPVKGALDIAQQGGKHAGFLKNYMGKPASQIQRGIKSIERDIADHLDKIANPKSHIPDWDTLDPRRQEALINKIWPSDVARQREQLDILQGLLRSLGGGS